MSVFLFLSASSMLATALLAMNVCKNLRGLVIRIFYRLTPYLFSLAIEWSF